MRNTRISTEVEQVVVHRGEVLTVFLYPADPGRIPAECAGTQVELRVTPDGCVEIFTHNMEQVFEFTNWYNPDDKDAEKEEG